MATMTRDRNLMTQILEELTDSATDGTLTEERLSETIRMQYDGRDVLPESIGGNWILLHPTLFAESVKDVTAFLRSHIGERGFMENVLQSVEVMKLVPETLRSSFVFEAYVVNGSHLNDTWIHFALKAGVPREVLANAIEARIWNAAPEDPEHSLYTVYLEFMEGGDGDWKEPGLGQLCPLSMVSHLSWANRSEIIWDEDCAWSLFGEADFYNLVLICAQKSPRRVLEHRSDLCLKLSPPLLEKACILAAKRITKIDTLKPAELRKLPLDARLSLAKRLEIDKIFSRKEVYAAFLVGLLIDLDYDRCYQVYSDLRSQFDRLDAPLTVYRTALPYLAKAKNQRLAAKLKEVFAFRLEESGFVFGTIQKGPSPKGGYQWQVAYNGLTYIQDRGEHRYFPREGDEVIFMPRSARRLTPYVAVAYFSPVDASKERS